ncbi:VOC family protein [Amycolatopsis japonica]|uniref:VOC family protein n=1 Tax=Amycolatopsis japonica TaxID=208439 RepID=UPI0037B61CA0
MARLRDVVFDCRHPASLARFWAAALDGYEVAPYDEEELDRLRSLGFSGPEEDPSVLVEAASGPRLFFNLVPCISDPEGNEFCLVTPPPSP